MSVLVTGASGFVGSWLVRRLVEQGQDVHVLHRPSSDLEELKGLPFVSHLGDVTDAASVQRAVQDVQTVFHLAGLVGYSRAMHQPMNQVNVEGTRHVVDAVRKAKRPPRLIYMSSVVAIGASFEPQPLNESSPFSIHHLNLGYFETKKAAEDLVLTAARQNQIEAIALNPSTIYGPGDAKKNSRKTQLKVARGKFPFYTSGGVSIVSVHDVVDVLLKAQTQGRSGERYILSGENLTIQDLFQRLARLAGVKPPSVYLAKPVVHAIGKVGDWLETIGKKGPLNSENAWTALLYHWFDHSKAAAEFGFQPRAADLALAESVGWMKQQGMLE